MRWMVLLLFLAGCEQRSEMLPVAKDQDYVPVPVIIAEPELFDDLDLLQEVCTSPDLVFGCMKQSGNTAIMFCYKPKWIDCIAHETLHLARGPDHSH